VRVRKAREDPGSLESVEFKRFFSEILKFQEKHSLKLYLVGGFVRDLVLGNTIAEHDCDFVLEGDVYKAASGAADHFGGKVLKFPSFLTAKVSGINGYGSLTEIDFAQARTEEYPSPGALPLVKPGTIEQDIHRRDFTINAVALSLDLLDRVVQDQARNEISDLYFVNLVGGFDDIRTRTVRILHERSFLDDPTRIFRAVRYQTRLDGSLENHTLTALEHALSAGALRTISAHRKWTELRKIIYEDNFGAMLLELCRLGILEQIEEFGQINQQRLLSDLAGATEVLRAASVEDRFSLFMLLLADQAGEESLGWPGLPKRRRRELVALLKGDSSNSSLLAQLWDKVRPG